MNPSNTLRVIAVDGARVPRYDELGRAQPGCYVGLNAAGEPEAETVPDTQAVRRALRRGDLREAPPEEAVPESPTPSSPSTEP